MTPRAIACLEKLQALLSANSVYVAESYRSVGHSDVALHAWPCGSAGQIKVYVEVLNLSVRKKVESILRSYGYDVEHDPSHTDSVYLNVTNAV